MISPGMMEGYRHCYPQKEKRRLHSSSQIQTPSMRAHPVHVLPVITARRPTGHSAIMVIAIPGEEHHPKGRRMARRKQDGVLYPRDVKEKEKKKKKSPPDFAQGMERGGNDNGTMSRRLGSRTCQALSRREK